MLFDINHSYKLSDFLYNKYKDQIVDFIWPKYSMDI